MRGDSVARRPGQGRVSEHSRPALRPPVRLLLLLLLASVALTAVAALAHTNAPGSLDASLESGVHRSLVDVGASSGALALARAKASACVEGPWYAEVALAPGSRAFKDFVDPASGRAYTLEDARRIALEPRQAGSPWRDLTWARARAIGGEQLVRFKEFRALYVRAIAFLLKYEGFKGVKDPCPYCLVRGQGSTDPGSDMDLDVIGHEAHKFIRAWNGLFESYWPGGKSSGEVFMTYLYGTVWVWPTSAYVNLKDAEARTPGAQQSLLLSKSPDGSVVSKMPLCYQPSEVGGEQQLVFAVPSQDQPQDEENQRQWAIVHWLLYALASEKTSTCSLGRSARSLETGCPAVQRMLAQPLSTKSRSTFARDVRAALQRLTQLVQAPCRRNPSYCRNGSVKMDAPRVRSALYLSALDAYYASIDPALSQSRFRAQPHYCLATKSLLSTAAFWAEEAYLAQGTVLHIVTQVQAGHAALPFVRRAQYVDSLIEQVGDLEQEVAELGNERGDTQEHASRWVTKASKYLVRLMDASARLAVERAALPQRAQAFQRCMAPPLYALQKKVRNQVADARTAAIAKCAMDEINACVAAYRGGAADAQATATTQAIRAPVSVQPTGKEPASKHSSPSVRSSGKKTAATKKANATARKLFSLASPNKTRVASQKRGAAANKVSSTAASRSSSSLSAVAIHAAVQSFAFEVLDLAYATYQPRESSSGIRAIWDTMTPSRCAAL